MNLNNRLSKIEKGFEKFNEESSIAQYKLLKKDVEFLKSDIISEIKNLKSDVKTSKKNYDDWQDEIDFRIKQTEALFKTSWKWRIGSIFVEFAVLIEIIVTSPLQFFKRPHKYLKEYYGHVFPNTEKLVRKVRIHQKEKASLLPLPEISKSVDKIEISAILDDFTLRCFEPEFNLNLLSRENYSEELNQPNLSALFVESSWKGNNLQWRGEIGKYVYNNENEVIKSVVSDANKKSLPTIFWNKEDPVHYDHFKVAASLFDYVFTSDRNSIKKYKNLGCKNVFALPFAAQPKIHNPVLSKKRQDSVCFAGTYWREKYFERQRQLNFLLKPSKKFGLSIYDRNFKNGASPEHYSFPEYYSENIKGGVPYTEMVNIYREYKVFLNVNSVNESPTMFSRRVFEILASGTPIISPPNKGVVNLLGDDIVLFSSSEKETEMHLEKLFSDKVYWKKLSLKGIRKVHSQHTYAHRANYIMEKVGLSSIEKDNSQFNIIFKLKNKNQIPFILKNISNQVFKANQLFCFTDLQNVENEFGELNIKFVKLSKLDKFLSTIRNTCKDDFFHFWNPSNFYGPDYLLDYKLATKYSDVRIFGKASFYSLKHRKLRYLNEDNEFLLSDSINYNTLMIHENFITSNTITNFLESTDSYFQDTINEVLSLDCFNFIDNPDSSTIDSNLISKVLV